MNKWNAFKTNHNYKMNNFDIQQINISLSLSLSLNVFPNWKYSNNTVILLPIQIAIPLV